MRASRDDESNVAAKSKKAASPAPACESASVPSASAPSPARSVKPYAFIVGFGVVSMLMDVVYEAAISVQGPLLASLGASAFIVGLVSGLGEATALAGRLFSGPLADRTGRYWLFAILGYAATAVAVPAMGFVGSLGAVAFLVVFERFGKSLRTPSRDAMLSHAASAVGRGKGFALHEVMDQIGAMAGPLMVAALLSATNNDYRVALGVLIIPGTAAICVLLALRHRVPRPQVFETQDVAADRGSEGREPAVADSAASDSGAVGSAAVASAAAAAVATTDESSSATAATTADDPSQAPTRRVAMRQLPHLFWLYTAACGIMLAGVATFGVLSFHMINVGLADDAAVPVIYAVAMGIDAVFAAISGVLYDKLGTRVLLVLPFLCVAIPFFAYTENLVAVIVGVVLWGASLGIQESTMRAAVSEMVNVRLRATAYGMFSVAVGIGSLVGGVVAGALYDVSVPALIGYAVCVEAVAFVLLLKAVGRKRLA